MRVTGFLAPSDFCMKSVGPHRFFVNTQPMELGILPRDGGLARGALGLAVQAQNAMSSLVTRVAEWLGGPKEVTVIIDPRLLESLLRALFLERVGLDRVVSGLSSAADRRASRPSTRRSPA